ncbi:MAG: hypothetical protein OEW48_12545 [Phycisphaerae bacterium]|nr:hypothetical protein [Phycisphaerae bacterium]
MKKLLLIIGILLIGVILFFVAQYLNFGNKANEMTNLLSKDDINTINSYRGKYQSCPGPSDAEVLDVAKILLRAKLTKDDIEKLLGKPSDVRTLEKPIPKISGDSLEYWGYDVGDSRRIKICFDGDGNITSIQGAGVGFDKPIYPPKDINNPPMD